MPSVTFALEDGVKQEVTSKPWINWSEVAREEAEKEVRRAADLEEALRIVSKSKLTMKDAMELGGEIKLAMHKSLKERLKES